jgi:hypothetical protein
MKVKGGYKVDVWYDESIRMYAAAYKDINGNQLGDAEYAPSKTLALQWLEEHGPEIEVEKEKGRGENRDY